MITKPTAFVLGAGASMDYKYPSGKQLKDYIVGMTKNKYTYRKENDILRIFGFDEHLIREFSDDLEGCGLASVDSFLEGRKELLEIGKVAIAIAIIRHEQKNHLRNSENDWYEYIFQIMKTSFEEFGNNSLSIITFNYDRSLEFFLYSAIKKSYGKSTQEVVGAFKSIPIEHVHGIVCEPDWWNETGWDYSAELSYERIDEAKDEIKIMYDPSILENFLPAKEILRNSKRIVFLGFGFHDENIIRLDLDSLDSDVELYGSAYELTAMEKAIITQKFSHEIQLGHRHHKVLDYLRENINLSRIK